MDHQSSWALQQFKNYVGIKFQLYNSLFTSLPFHRIERTGILLSLLLNNCEEGYKKKQSPQQIIEEFFQKHTALATEREKIDMLFRFIQFTERQIVLFDALEDAAFKEVNDMNGVGTLKQLEAEVIQFNKEDALKEKLKRFGIRLVLTAHPTQFYPGTVLGIINDLNKALQNNDASLVNMYLQQLAKTPFFKKKKPTPYDEAISLVWYLENVFYHAAGKILTFLKNQFGEAVSPDNPIITMGFWPGGDRDGNPFVTSEITLKVADALRGSIIKCYYLEVRKIKRRLTFKGIEEILVDLENKLYDNLFVPEHKTGLHASDLLNALEQIRTILIHQHNGLFLNLVDSFISKVQVFGLHFASLDVRQDSSIHVKVFNTIAESGKGLPANYTSLTESEQIDALTSITETLDPAAYSDITKETLESVLTIKKIQEYNGEVGCNRYIISQCNSARNVMEVYGLFLLTGWKKEEIAIDIIPLFETVDDLQNAKSIMHTLYSNEVYREHLKRRNDLQTIMVGFSDGTKDGGYLMANWSIYKAKEELTSISKEYGIDVVFFDGRGGPPARGGGKTHKFYASMGNNISNEQIQLTIQGQTVSSNFGTKDSAQFNIEQLLNAGITNNLINPKENTLDQNEDALMQELANLSFKAYIGLKEHPMFTEYLANISPLKFYSETNIGSRPAKRGSGNKLNLKDLRAIPFVGAWSQLKQNVTGYYGVGTALQAIERQGKWNEVKDLYHDSMFFRTLIGNCEMAMKKCYFPLTEYLANDPKYGEIWNMIYQEYELTQKYVSLLSGRNELMSEYPVEQLSVQMRERIVLPLTTIQQYAITRIREIEEGKYAPTFKEIYEKLVIRSSFGIINAGRNSA